jgi:di/tricarboxylate transporter
MKQVFKILLKVAKTLFRGLRTTLRWSRQPEYRWLWCAAAALLYLTLRFWPLPGVDTAIQPALAVFAVAAFLWGTNTLPLAVTGIIVLFLIPVSQTLSSAQTYAYFGNPAVFFVLTISFVEWTLWSLPAVLLLLGVAYGLILLIGRGSVVSMKEAHRYLEARSRSLGKISRREGLTALIVLLTVILWVFRGEAWGLDTIAFLGVVLSFILRIADWREVEEDVNWGIFVMYGSAIALSAMLRETGAAEALAQGLTSWINSPGMMLSAIILLTVFLTEGMSNAAAVAVLMPVALALAGEYDIDPRAMTLAVTVPSGLAFMLPSAAPAIAIAIGGGYVSPFEAFCRGFWLKLSGFLLFLVMAQFYWPLVGLGSRL